MRDAYFLGLTYLAISLNGFWAPVVFQVFKDSILFGEAYAVVWMNGLFGIQAETDGTRLFSESGMRLQLIGACSVYEGLSLALLGYASLKAFMRKVVSASDFGVIALLVFALFFLNSLRLGLMTLDYASYEYWHHDEGTVYFGMAQLLVVVSVSLFFTARPRLKWQK